DAILWVVDEGMVETAGVMEVADVAFKANMEPKYDTTGDKMGEFTAVGGGAK
ncbi:hypothetical protein KI387_008056, partial [Taxus chinensis]